MIRQKYDFGLPFSISYGSVRGFFLFAFLSIMSWLLLIAIVIGLYKGIFMESKQTKSTHI